MQIDDGSGAPWDDGSYLQNLDSTANIASAKGVLVVDLTYLTDQQTDGSMYGETNIGDYVAVTGISSQWTEGGNSYRTIRFPSGMANISIPASSVPSETAFDTENIPITVKVYSETSTGQPASVNVYTNTGQRWTVSISGYDGNGVGTGSVTWQNVSDAIPYVISAESPGFKTRTFTDVDPDYATGGFELDLVPLRKIYPLTAGAYELNPCGGSPPASTTETTRVVDANHNPIAGQPVRFWTDYGTFASGSSLTQTTVYTDTTGTAQVNVYAVYKTAGTNAWVMATSDQNAPWPQSYYDLSAERRDWVCDSVGCITVDAYSPVLSVSPTTTTMTQCQADLPVTATVTACDGGVSNAPVTFTVNSGPGTIDEANGGSSFSTTTGTGGTATIHVHQTGVGTIVASVSSTPHGVQASGSGSCSITVEGSDILTVTITPAWVVSGTPATVKAQLTLPDGVTPVPNQSVTLTTNQGSFNPHDGTTQNYTANTDSTGCVTTALTVSQCPATATVTGTATITGGCPATGSANLLVVCSASSVKTLMIVLDGTGSMTPGGANKATAGLTQLIDSAASTLSSKGKILIVGGVYFGNFVDDPCHARRIRQPTLSYPRPPTTVT